MHKLLRVKRPGNFIIIVLVVITFAMIEVAAAYGLVSATSKIVRGYAYKQTAIHIAEAGVDRSVWCLNHPSTCGNPYSGETRQLTGGEYVATITTLSTNVRKIDVTSYIPSQSQPDKTAHLQASIGIDSTTISFNYGVEVGNGGLEMQNNSQIIGNVYANGPVLGSNGASITGDTFVATGMTLDQSWEIQNQDQIFGLKASNCSSSTTDVAESFTPSSSETLNMVSLYIKKNGNPADISIHIVADDSGHPSTTALSTGTLSSNLVTNSYNWANVTFPSPATLTSGTTYWLVADANCEKNKYWIWGKDSNNGYGNGIAKASSDWSSEGWSSLTGDLNFRTYLGGSPTALDSVNIGGDAHANTISNATVTGDAYYQSIFNSTVSGSACPNSACHPGSDDPPVQPFPVSDGNIVQWEQEAENGVVVFNDLNITADTTIGPEKIVGNLTVGNGATVTLNGPVWVKGNILFDTNAAIQLNPDFGDGSTVIIADDPDNPTVNGQITIQNNANFLGTSSTASFIMLLSNYEGAGHAIEVTNNTQAAIFYAHKGSIYLANNVNLKEVTGHTIIMSQNATINYESGLANASFTSGPGASWKILSKSWREF